MSPQKTDDFASYLGQKLGRNLTPEETKTHFKMTLEEAAAAVETVPQDYIARCPMSVQQLCSHKKQDQFEKDNGIAPGCGYYRRRHNAFLKRSPGKIPPKYYLEYGEKYCNRFTKETYGKLSPEGQEWLNKVKCGLQQGLEKEILQSPYPEMRELEYDNDGFKSAAFEMHSKVYLKNGLADLYLADQVVIAKTPWEEFFIGDNVGATWKQAFDVLPDVAIGKAKQVGDLRYLEASDALIWDF